MNDAALELATWEDLQAAGLPPLLARQVAAEFRTKDARPHYSKKHVNRMSFEELFAAYDPDPTVVESLAVTERLFELSHGKRCAVFVNGKVHVEKSVDMLKWNRTGLETGLTLVDGTPTQVYRIGEQPDVTAPQNPIWFEKPLQGPDEICTQTLRSWKGVSLKTRQLVYTAKIIGELVIRDRSDAHDLIDRAHHDPESLSARYPKATVALARTEKLGQAPSMKTVVKTGSVATNHPFYA